MGKIVEVRGIRIGEGIPKICIPLTGKTKEEILAAAEKLPAVGTDLVEWRTDWFEDISDFTKVEEVLRELRRILGNTPLLFTFRTKREGGEKDLGPAEYTALNQKAVSCGWIDLVDVELFSGEEAFGKIVAEAHAHGVKVIASNHDFEKTPEKDELVRRLRRMQELGADIPKIAVMPNGKKDVLTLLAATEEMASEYADGPIITMSMAGEGLISRLCGEVFGSALTFGTAGAASAPGQMDAGDLHAILTLLHKGMYD